ncbi:MAG: hypothetical protein H2069_08655 [Legionella sp.]|nr:hypothetical protein [Legionella sp.]
MTIFVDVILEQLEQEIAKIKTTSLSDDHSFGNRALSKCTNKAFGRNLSLAEIKRSLADNLLKDLLSLKEQAIEKNLKDERVYEKMREKILNCRREGAQKSADFASREGNFGLKLNKMSLFLDTAFDKLKEVDLLNIPHDDDPLNIFRYHASIYYRDKIFASVKEINLTQSVSNLTRHGFMRGNIVGSAKDKLLCLTIQRCIQTFDELSEEKRHDPAVRARYLDMHLKLLEEENNQLCKRNALIRHVGFGYNLLGRFYMEVPNARPGVGQLGACIKSTREVLSNICSMQEGMSLLEEERISEASNLSEVSDHLNEKESLSTLRI